MAKKKDKTNWDKIEDEIKAMKPLTLKLLNKILMS